MVVENVKILEIAEKLYIYIYIYIIHLTYLYFNSITTLHHSVVSKILLYSLCLIVCNVSGSVAMVTRNHSTNGAYRRRGHVKPALGIGLRTRLRLISVSPRYIVCLEYVSASRISSCFISHCYTCIKAWVKSEILSSTKLEKQADFLEFERYAVGYIFETVFTAVIV